MSRIPGQRDLAAIIADQARRIRRLEAQVAALARSQVSTSSVTLYDGNVLANPGFEAGLLSWATNPAVGTDIAGSAWAAATDAPIAGDYSAVQYPPYVRSYSQLWQPIAVPVAYGQTWLLECTVLASLDVSTVRLLMASAASSDALLSWSAVTTTPAVSTAVAGGVATRLSGLAAVPAGAVAAAWVLEVGALDAAGGAVASGLRVAADEAVWQRKIA